MSTVKLNGYHKNNFESTPFPADKLKALKISKYSFWKTCTSAFYDVPSAASHNLQPTTYAPRPRDYHPTTPITPTHRDLAVTMCDFRLLQSRFGEFDLDVSQFMVCGEIPDILNRIARLCEFLYNLQQFLNFAKSTEFNRIE